MGKLKFELSNVEYDRIAAGLDSLPYLASADDKPVIILNRVSAFRDIVPGAGIEVYTQRQGDVEPAIPVRILGTMTTAEWEARGLVLFTYEKI